MKLNINEATLPDWKDSIIEEVKNVLNNNHLYGSVYEDKDFGTDNSFMLCVEIIDGDWKHDHARTNYTITTLLDNYDNIEVTNLGEEVIGEETGGDWYSAIHKYMIIRYENDKDFKYDDIDNAQLDIAFANESVSKKSLSEEIVGDAYEYIKSKSVMDYNGWYTDYTMWYDYIEDMWLCVLGDNDVYNPSNTEPDAEFDTEAEANDWYDNYNGYEDEENFDECYLSEGNNNTEEQELAEFLDWLKQEKIPVANVNKKFKMIHLQNPKDLDMASWYLHDRDYFKKLSDFGWMVGAPSPAGKKVAKALKMESMEFDGFTYSDVDIVEALAYMYGISYEEVRTALKNNEFTDNEIKRAITYWNLDGYNPKEKQAEYNRRCKELGICESTEHIYRVWYRPYLLDGDEEDYIDVTAPNEDEAKRRARTSGWVVDVELLESK